LAEILAAVEKIWFLEKNVNRFTAGRKNSPTILSIELRKKSKISFLSLIFPERMARSSRS